MDAQKFLDELRGLQRIVINDCYGGFSLSDRARREYCRMAGIELSEFLDSEVARDDPYLVKIVKDLGMGANGSCANLKVVEIPGDVDWQIEEHVGAEWIAEKHRTWS